MLDSVINSMPAPTAVKKGKSGEYNLKKGVEAVSGKTRQEQLKEILESQGGGGMIRRKIPSYSEGASYIPQTQLAVVHKGEAIIPAEYNMGGLIRDRYRLGGEILQSKILGGIESLGEKLGDAIVRKIEEAEIDIKVPTRDELPKLEIGNLEDLRVILEGGAVGADRTSKLDDFIDLATDKLDRLEEQSINNTERITVVETQTSAVNELGDIKLSINNLEEQIAEIYTKPEKTVDFTDERSYMERRLNEEINALKNEQIIPIESNIRRLDLLISDINIRMDGQLDIVYSNINRLDLK
jgi:hypothetical protein